MAIGNTQERRPPGEPRCRFGEQDSSVVSEMCHYGNLCYSCACVALDSWCVGFIELFPSDGVEALHRAGLGLLPHWHVNTLGSFQLPRIIDMLTRCVVWVARFDTVYPGQNTLESSRNACEIKNDEAKHAACNYSALFHCFILFFPVQSKQEKWKCVTWKTSEHAAWSSRKCHLVLLCLCDHILGLEEKYFCGTNGCSPTTT